MTTNSPEYVDKLKEIAPSVAIVISREPDPSCRWDGDGPDPEESGYSAYDVDVDARIIMKGELVARTASLGSCYYQPDEPIGDVYGYLPQMLEEVLTALRILTIPLSVVAEIDAAVAYLQRTMQETYEVQRAEKVIDHE